MSRTHEQERAETFHIEGNSKSRRKIQNQKRDSGVKEELITFVTLFSCEVGVSKVRQNFPNVHMLTASVDSSPNGADALDEFNNKFYEE